METTVKERIIAFYTSKGISKRLFERTCGLSNGYIDKLKDSPTASKIADICRAYPTLNQDWLLTGEGEMLKTEGATNIVKDVVQGNNSKINQGCDFGGDDICSDLRAEIAYLREMNRKLLEMLANIKKSDN